jgi:hypothetical protein
MAPKPCPGLLDVERSHAAALPAEDCIEFSDSRAVVREPDGARLADTKRALGDASGVASCAEIRGECILGERLSPLAAYKSEITRRADVEDSLQV